MKLHWGNGIAIFFAIFLTLAAIFIVFSFRQHNDLVDKDYYQKGANYTEQMKINSRSEKYIDSILIRQKDSFFEVTFCPTIQKESEQVFVHFFRPSDQQLDLKYELNPTNSNNFIPISELQKGRYIVKFNWTQQQENYFIQKDLFVP